MKILYTGIINGGSFDETAIENSELKKLGVGRILDLLALLKERSLIELANNKFTLTKKGYDTLWNKKTPLWARILRILEIKPLEIADIAKYLNEYENDITQEIEQLRKNHLVLLFPLREGEKLTKNYEIMQDGKEKLREFEKGTTSKSKIPQIVEEILEEINQTNLNEEQKQKLTEKLNQIKKLSDS